VSKQPTTPITAVLLLLLAQVAFGQGQQTAPTGESQVDQPADEDLATKVVDPTAILTSLTFQNSFTPSHWGIDDKANQMTFQAVVPFKVWDVQNIGRVRVPYTTSSPLGTRGLSDVALLDIVVLRQEWGNLFMGAVGAWHWETCSTPTIGRRTDGFFSLWDFRSTTSPGWPSSRCGSSSTRNTT